MSPDKISKELGAVLAARNLTICTAESCTGGLIATMITDVPGSSRYFMGGAIVYANEAKVRVLGVPASFLTSFGAVSAPVAFAMARGSARLFQAHIALSTTGIAGPTGGTAEKPAGLVYIGIVAPGYAACHRLVAPYDRLGNRRHGALTALSLAYDLVTANVF